MLQPDSRSFASVSPKTVMTMAIVNVNWEERNHDYIDNFVPIVAHCVKTATSDTVSLGDVQAALKSEFDLTLPQGAIRTVLRRARDVGYVRIDHGVYVRNATALADIDLGSSQAEATRRFSDLVSALQNFAQSSFGLDWDQGYAEKAFLEYLEQNGEQILAAAFGAAELSDGPATSKQKQVVVNAFVLYLSTNEAGRFEYLTDVTKGMMLASVLYLDVKRESERTRLDKVEVYLDTPFLIRALRYAPAELQVSAEELVALLQSSGARLRVFEHTYHELELVLRSAADNYRRGATSIGPGDIVEQFAAMKYSSSDVELAIAELPDRLAQLTVETVAEPEYSDEINIDEDELEQILNAEHAWRRKETLVRDIRSLTAIHNLRDGKPVFRLDSSSAIFVTTNAPLARLSAKFFEDHFDEKGCVPVCSLASTLATVLWLRNPHQAPQLPARQLIATSYAALDPGKRLWRKYLDEVERLHGHGDLTDEQVVLLIYSREARRELVQMTLGDDELLLEGSVATILERATSKVQEAADAKVDEAHAAADAKVAEANADTETARGSLARERENRDTTLKTLSGRAATVIAFSVAAAATVVLAIGAAVAFGGFGFLPSGGVARLVAMVCLVGAALFGLATAVTGTSVAALYRRFQGWTAERIYGRLTSLFEPTDTP